MKKLLLLTVLLIYSISYSQDYSKTPEDLGFSEKEYKKIKKSLDISITNRDFFFDLEDNIYIGFKNGATSGTEMNWVELWKDVIFEMGLNQGDLDEGDYSGNADWIFVIDEGGIDLKVLDYNHKNKSVARVTSSEKQWGVFSNKSKKKFKNRIKVFLNELLNIAN